MQAILDALVFSYYSEKLSKKIQKICSKKYNLDIDLLPHYRTVPINKEKPKSGEIQK
jgi:hypothetical protein